MSKKHPVIPFPHGRSNSPPQTNSPSSPRKERYDPLVSFHRSELTLILSRYGMMVAKGEWRDYAIDMGRDSAVFSIFRHTSECPLFRLEKHPKLAQKQGAYLIRNDKGMILKRGRDLSQVLKVFDKRLELVDR